MKHEIDSNTDTENPFTVEMLITPEWAKEILSRPFANRNPSDLHIAKIRYDIEHGRWIFNGETIKISRGGSLLDGQTRLQAVIMSKMPIRSLVVFNLPDDTMPTIDIGRQRSLANILEMRGMKNTNVYSSAIRVVCNYCVYGVYQGGTALTQSCFDDFMGLFSKELEKYVSLASKELWVNLVYPTRLIGLMILFSTVDEKRTDDFIQGLCGGSEPNSITYRLREKLLIEKGKRAMMRFGDVAGCITYWFNRFLSCKRIERLSFFSSMYGSKIKGFVSPVDDPSRYGVIRGSRYRIAKQKKSGSFV